MPKYLQLDKWYKNYPDKLGVKMRIITKRRINKAAEEIIDAVLDHADFEVDVNGPQDYDVLMFINKKDKPAVAKLLYEILTDKKPRKRWQLINVAVRKAK